MGPLERAGRKMEMVSITGKEPPAAAKGHGITPTLVKRDLRHHEAKLEFTDLDFCELALVTVLRRLEHVVGLFEQAWGEGERKLEGTCWPWAEATGRRR